MLRAAYRHIAWYGAGVCVPPSDAFATVPLLRLLIIIVVIIMRRDQVMLTGSLAS